MPAVPASRDRARLGITLPTLSDGALVAAGAVLTTALVAATFLAAASPEPRPSSAQPAIAGFARALPEPAPQGRTTTEPLLPDAAEPAAGEATEPAAREATEPAAGDAVEPTARLAAESVVRVESEPVGGGAAFGAQEPKATPLPAPGLPATVMSASASPPAAATSASAAPAATPAAARIFLHVPGDLPEGASVARRLSLTLTRLGYSVVETRTVGFTVSQPRVRYFFPADAGEAARLARELTEFRLVTPGGVNPVVVQDYTHFRPLPSPGNIEVWLPSTVRAG